MFTRKPKTIRIPSEWYSLVPHQRLAFWVRVARLAKKKGIRKKDYPRIKDLAIQLTRKEDNNGNRPN